jgi:hypothetical protein
MTYSYTQISQYLTCPRRYRHRYLDGWKEKDTRAAMLFGRAFEQALGALFRREDPGAVLFAEWSACQSEDLHYSNGDSWDRMLRQGIMLLDRFCQDDRIQIRQPQRNLQIKFNRPVAGKNDFVAYIDGIGKLDGKRCLLEWKTSSSRYPEEPEGLLSLDPQLVCYSWMTGIAEVAQIVFVRKRLVEVQYLHTTITTGWDVCSYGHRDFRKLEPSSRAHCDRAVSSVCCSWTVRSGNSPAKPATLSACEESSDFANRPRSRIRSPSVRANR